MSGKQILGGTSTLATLLVAAGCTTPSQQTASPATTLAQPAMIKACSELVTRFAFTGTTLQSATVVPAGALSVAGKPVASPLRGHRQNE